MPRRALAERGVFNRAHAGTTQASFLYAIKTKVWALPPASENFVALFFHRAVVARLRGLKQYCERNA